MNKRQMLVALCCSIALPVSAKGGVGGRAGSSGRSSGAKSTPTPKESASHTPIAPIVNGGAKGSKTEDERKKEKK